MPTNEDKAKFICTDANNNIGYGETENEAYEDYLSGGSLSAEDEDLFWCSVKPIQVSVKIQMKTVTETKITRK